MRKFSLSIASTLLVAAWASAQQPTVISSGTPQLSATPYSDSSYSAPRPSFRDRLRRLFGRGDTDTGNGQIVNSGAYTGNGSFVPGAVPQGAGRISPEPIAAPKTPADSAIPAPLPAGGPAPGRITPVPNPNPQPAPGGNAVKPEPSQQF